MLHSPSVIFEAAGRHRWLLPWGATGIFLFLASGWWSHSPGAPVLEFVAWRISVGPMGNGCPGLID
jgi:hypothetical protein